MARLLKCYGTCEKKYLKEELTKYKGKNYCQVCLKEKRRNDEDYEFLLMKIKHSFNIPYPNGMMLRQIKTFKEDRGYSYHNQGLAIDYIKNVLRKRMETKYGLGLIPYVIDDAVKYYKENEEKARKLKDVDSINNKQRAKISAKTLKENDYGKKKMINMEELFNE